MKSSHMYMGTFFHLNFSLNLSHCIFTTDTTDLYNKSQNWQSRNDSILQHFRLSEVFLHGLKGIVETLLSIVCRIHLKFSFFIIYKENNQVSRILFLKSLAKIQSNNIFFFSLQLTPYLTPGNSVLFLKMLG